jgi:hypothetical protein
LAGFFAFIRSNLCTRHIQSKLTPRGHHDWPNKRAIRGIETASIVPKSFYTGQCSSAMVLERSESAIVFFSFDLGLTWRPAGYLSNVVSHRRVALRSGIRSVIKSHRRAAGPHSQLATKIGKYWPVKSGCGKLTSPAPVGSRRTRRMRFLGLGGRSDYRDGDKHLDDVSRAEDHTHESPKVVQLTA